jgi:hypothetical protein
MTGMAIATVTTIALILKLQASEARVAAWAGHVGACWWAWSSAAASARSLAKRSR